jgi:hypothetical protein
LHADVAHAKTQCMTRTQKPVCGTRKGPRCRLEGAATKWLCSVIWRDSAQRSWKSSGVVDEAMVDGVEGEFETVGDAQFVEDIVEMILYGLLADEELFTDLFIAIPLGH